MGGECRKNALPMQFCCGNFAGRRFLSTTITNGEANAAMRFGTKYLAPIINDYYGTNFMTDGFGLFHIDRSVCPEFFAKMLAKTPTLAGHGARCDNSLIHIPDAQCPGFMRALNEALGTFKP